MTFLRKWRFPILIGGGLIAAGVLAYFGSAHVRSDKTQGAIGQRDVYRDGQVNSADVAKPGSAPVAIQAILQSSEYKTLAKDPQFQQLMSDGDFAELARENPFIELLRDKFFQEAVRNPKFSELVHTSAFKSALLENRHKLDSEILVRHRLDAQLRDLLKDEAVSRVLHNELFLQFSMRHAFLDLTSSKAFLASMHQELFLGLLRRSDFSSLFVRDLSAGSSREN